MRISRVGLLYCSFLSAFTLTTACGDSTSPVPPISPSETVVNGPDTTSNFWLPSSAESLLSAEGTFVRAAMESYAGVVYASDGQFAYPGFVANSDIKYVNSIPAAPPDQIRPKMTAAYSIMSVETLGPSIRGAKICSAAQQKDEGMRPSEIEQGVLELRYLTRGPDPIAVQSGPASRPSIDVFGGWRLQSYSRLKSDASPESRQCAAKGLDRYLGRPSSPGWPASSATPSLSTEAR